MRVVIALTGVAFAAGLAAQKPAEISSADLQSAQGVETTLWASEPAVTNPTNITVDERGRVWVLEAVNYRRALRNQDDLREGGDRIVILEDTDRDGRADSTTVFDQGPHLRAPLGIAVLGDNVYVSQSPDLTVYTKDADDRIVSKEVLLTGFGGVDHDHGLHAIVFGPDGRLYFNQGNTGMSVTDRSGRTVQSSSYLNDPLNSPTAGYFQGVALRMNPDGTGLEVLGQNFRNPYELAVDSFGNVFQTDNDDDGNRWTRLNYVMAGGNFGYRGPLHLSWNADRGGHFHNELPGVVPNVLRLGPGSPCGLLVYEGDLLPASYRGQLFHAEAGKRIVAAYPLTADGAGFTTTIEELVFGGDDTWFRPSDVAVAPDGSVFVADWYDPGVGGHNMQDPEGGRGRIYRVAPPGHLQTTPAVDLDTDDGLVAAFGSPNQSVRYLAHTAIVGRGPAAAPLLQVLWRQENPVLRARALWILGGLPGGGDAIDEALRDPEPRFRILGLRVGRHHAADILSLAQPLLEDASPQVRREIAILLRDTDPARMRPPYLSTVQVTPQPAWLDAMVSLISQYDGADRWYLEALAIAARGREDALYARLVDDAASSHVRADVVWALRPKTAIPDLVATARDASESDANRLLAIDSLGNMEWPEATRALEALVLADETPEALVAAAFSVYARQLHSLWSDERESAAVPRLVRKALSIPASQQTAVGLIGRLLDPVYLADLQGVAGLETADADARAAAVALLATTRDVAYEPELRAWAETGPLAMRVEAVRGVGLMSSPDAHEWAEGLLLGSAPNEVRVEALRVMAASTEGLEALLDLAERGDLPGEFRSLATTLTHNAGRGRGNRGRGGFASVLGRAGGSAGGGRGRGGAPSPEIVAVRERATRVLPLPTTAARPIPSQQALERDYRGDAEAGQRVFEVDGGCAACHTIGGGRRIGPDLSAIGAKYGKQAMLDQLVRPNDAIGFEYVVTTLTLADGETLGGIVTESTPDAIVVQAADGSLRRVPVADVRSRQQSGVSLMPEGLLDALSLQQISDLLEYLDSLGGSGAR